MARQTLALRVNAEVDTECCLRTLSRHFGRSLVAERVPVKFLVAIAGEIVPAQKILVLRRRGDRVHVFRDDVAAGTANGLAPRRFERGHMPPPFSSVVWSIR
jgi:hypothetical protein